MNTVNELNDSTFAAELKNHEVALVDIFASWCGSCRLFAPVFDQVATEYPDFAFFKIDGEKNPTFLSAVEIDNLPFVAVFHRGEYVGGKSTGKKEALLDMINTIRAKVSS